MGLFKSEGVGELLKRIYIDFSKLLFQYILYSRSVQKISVIIYEFDKKQPNVIRKLSKLEDIKDWIAQAKKCNLNHIYYLFFPFFFTSV